MLRRFSEAAVVGQALCPVLFESQIFLESVRFVVQRQDFPYEGRNRQAGDAGAVDEAIPGTWHRRAEAGSSRRHVKRAMENRVPHRTQSLERLKGQSLARWEFP